MAARAGESWHPSYSLEYVSHLSMLNMTLAVASAHHLLYLLIFSPHLHWGATKHWKRVQRRPHLPPDNSYACCRHRQLPDPRDLSCWKEEDNPGADRHLGDES